MITRHEAEDQAQACFMYHVGAFALTSAALALSGSRAASAIASTWGLGVAMHGLLLYGVPDTREKILMWTAAGMEERHRLLQAGDANEPRLAIPCDDNCQA